VEALFPLQSSNFVFFSLDYFEPVFCTSFVLPFLLPSFLACILLLLSRDRSSASGRNFVRHWALGGRLRGRSQVPFSKRPQPTRDGLQPTSEAVCCILVAFCLELKELLTSGKVADTKTRHRPKCALFLTMRCMLEEILHGACKDLDLNVHTETT